MSERGVVAIDRGVFDHECFAPEPFTEREAWMWLIAEAAWKARTRRVGNFVAELKRGQLAASLRFMADKWQWHYSSVVRYLEKLRKHTMIATEAKQGITVITICNYDAYQRVSLPDTTQSETANETEAKQTRNKTEYNKYIEIDDRDGGERKIETLTEDFFSTIHVDPKNPELSGFAGLPHYVSMWVERGYDRGLILATAADIYARAGPQKPLKYYATAIENAHLQGPPKQPDNRNGQPRQGSKPNTLAGALAQLDVAADRLESGRLSEGGETPPRLLSHG